MISNHMPIKVWDEITYIDGSVQDYSISSALVKWRYCSIALAIDIFLNFNGGN